MEPTLGWTLLSRDALRRAETQLRDEVQGVRDEIGFLAVHQAYADRFFPGTSVLHTRLRYRLALGQPNQEDLIDVLSSKGEMRPSDVRDAVINLSPWFSNT